MAAAPAETGGLVTAVLETSGLGRRFGALRAVDDVALNVEAGARHALIGPNGAGKSTLFRLVSGNLAPSSGQVVYQGRDITRLAEHRRARLGIAQTFQHSSLFLTMSALENVVLARQRLGGHGRRPVPGGPRRAIDREATDLLAQMGLDGRGRVPVAALSHGERRQLEVAVALATRPRLLLLDEPAAGMSPAETQRFADLVEHLPEEITIVLIEHDLDLVFRLASVVTVLHLGRILATGAPEDIRASTEVQESYLGTGRRQDLFLPAADATG
jgi:branched-chain amino acid transport system ATP-binding protein